jgi:mitogen-activated protein kinase kinase kinase
MRYFDHGMRVQKKADEDSQIRRFTRILQNLRLRLRKILQFSKGLSYQLENACVFALNGNAPLTKKILQCLADAGFCLVESNSPWTHQYVVITDDDLARRPGALAYLFDLPVLRDKVDTGHFALLMHVEDAVEWTGERVKMADLKSAMPIDVPIGAITLISAHSTLLTECRSRFEALLYPITEGNTVGVRTCPLDVITEQRSLFGTVNNQLAHLRSLSLKFAETLISSVATIRMLTGSVHCVDLIEDWFTFVSDFGYRTSKWLGRTPERTRLNRLMISLAVDWVSFTCSDCLPTDRKTFRWALMALEFVMMITQGSNILELPEDAFSLLRSKVACCMTLLITSFDMGASDPAITSSYGVIDGVDMSDFADEPAASTTKRVPSPFVSEPRTGVLFERLQKRLQQIQLVDQEREKELQSRGVVGKVLDDKEPEDQTIIQLLAASSSAVSMRWQQGKFLASGASGSVYVAVNLDTGALMAVKEIRLQDTNTKKQMAKSIRDEMSVLEVLNHPNVVSYYGIEIHRDNWYLLQNVRSHTYYLVIFLWNIAQPALWPISLKMGVLKMKK